MQALVPTSLLVSQVNSAVCQLALHQVDLCPVCLRKLSWNLACGTHEASPPDLTTWCILRYRRLLAHAERLGPVLHAYKLWLRSRLAQLDFNVLPAAAAAAAAVSVASAVRKDGLEEEEAEQAQVDARWCKPAISLL